MHGERDKDAYTLRQISLWISTSDWNWSQQTYPQNASQIIRRLIADFRLRAERPRYARNNALPPEKL